METVNRRQIMQGVDLTCVRSDKFKTGVLSITFMTQLDKATASKTALLMRVLRRGTSLNPTMEDIAARLDELYGAKIVPTVRKKGEASCVGLYASFPDDFFVDGDNILEKTAALMGEILLSPDTKNGWLRGDYVDSEKHALIQDIEALVNDKGAYANTRLTEIMCSGEAYGVRILGTEASVNSITASGLMKYYREFIAKSRVQIFYCGSAQPDKVEIAVKSALADLPRRDVDRFVATDVRTQPVKDKMRRHTQRMNVNQGKLCIGFRLGSAMLMPNYAVLTVMNGLFGGAINSKLFQNVREKLSLCYYAHSALEKHKGIITVSSGIAPENLKKAEKEIFTQLDDIKKGNITPQELESVKTEIITALRTSMDDPYRMENYWLDNSLLGLTIAPDELAALVSGVTIEDVVAAAQEVKADCLYFLTGKENENDA